jgi:2-oxoglutarate dehydrogenase E1 component
MMRRACMSAANVGAATAIRRVTDAQTIRAPNKYEQFLQSGNESFVAGLLEAYSKNKADVDPSWWGVLDKLLTESAMDIDPTKPMISGYKRPTAGGLTPADQNRIDTLKVIWMLRSFEQRGHLNADLDPLGVFSGDVGDIDAPELNPTFYGFTEADMDKVFSEVEIVKLCGKGATLRHIIDTLRKTFCGKVGYEFDHVLCPIERQWLRDELAAKYPSGLAEQDVLELVAKSEGFEKLFALKFQTMKRFGGEGGEALIAGLTAAINQSAYTGTNDVKIGMAHRGRLSILHNVLGRGLDKILNEFKGLHPKGEEGANNRGDVKYHLGFKGTDITMKNGKKVNIELFANPSHLETVNPVVVGAVVADNKKNGDDKSLSVLLHGDAAFAGQGICAEGVNMASLKDFDANGTIHIVTNNQVGFTTDPMGSRNCAYSSDLARMNGNPVFHVNADAPLEVARIFAFAAKFRAKFKRDVFIDFVCYRRNGHNETDQPRYTQPKMYKSIDKHETITKKFSKQLVADGVFTQEHADATVKGIDKNFREQYNAWETSEDNVKRVWRQPAMVDYPHDAAKHDALRRTGVDIAELQKLGMAMSTAPATFSMHPSIAPIIKKRHDNHAAGTGLDWGAAEQLAMATLLREGHEVRMTGQDIERATFAQRHYNLHDYKNGNTYNGLEKVDGAAAPCTIVNSCLSEYAMSGFEIGYSYANNNALVLWEAQFGDFANGAQVMWDIFLSGCELKWGAKNALVVSLPHGYDGQGPEHSSARIERFLQISRDDSAVPADFCDKTVSAEHLAERRILDSNWQVVFATTPANYFHVLRRQMRRDFRKPLISFFAKSLLRASVSDLADFAPGTAFQAVIDQPQITKARKVVFCHGQLYFQLLNKQEADKVTDVALVRIEQFSPFPWEAVNEVVYKYLTANQDVTFTFAQDEPRNMGVYPFARPRLNNLLREKGLVGEQSRIDFVGRAAAASPATGHDAVHKRELAEIVAGVFA